MTFEEIKKEAPADVAASDQSTEKGSEPSAHLNTNLTGSAIEAARFLAAFTIDHPKASDILWHLQQIIAYLKGEKK